MYYEKEITKNKFLSANVSVLLFVAFSLNYLTQQQSDTRIKYESRVAYKLGMLCISQDALAFVIFTSNSELAVQCVLYFLT